MYNKQSYKGKPVSQGIAIGPAYIFKAAPVDKTPAVEEKGGSAAEEQFRIGNELVRLETAVDRTKRHMDKIVLDAGLKAGKEAAQIFLMHKFILEGNEFINLSRICIEEGRMSAEDAVKYVGEVLASRFENMDDEYMRARGDDVRDIAHEVLDKLAEENKPEEEQNEDDDYPYILITDNLLPSDVVGLDKERVLGIVTVDGSPASHASILAHMMDIPMVVSVPLNIEDIEDGTPVYVNADTGEVILRPDVDFGDEVVKSTDPSRYELKHLIGKETLTSSGRHVDLYANIASVPDLKKAMGNDAEGIGLYRSEFIFMDKDEAPSEEEQLAAYTKLLSMSKGKPFTVRTMDIGGDKKLPYLDPGDLRGLKVSLYHTDLFRIQLRALVKASVKGNLRIMYPYVTDFDDVIKANTILGEVKWDLISEVGACSMLQGVMIETSESVDMASRLAEYSDFFSIGTNDLTQILYGIDRASGDLSAIDDDYEKLFLCIERVVRAAHKADIPVCVCGEIAGNRRYTKRLLDTGVDGLSVVPADILTMREFITGNC